MMYDVTANMTFTFPYMRKMNNSGKYLRHLTLSHHSFRQLDPTEVIITYSCSHILSY